MRKLTLMLMMAALVMTGANAKKKPTAVWPDGSVMTAWFADTLKIDPSTLGRQYVVTDYGVKADSTVVQTRAIQGVIDRCHEEGGGVVVIPRGTFLTGGLFFKPGTHLHIAEGGKLKGIDDIRHYELIQMHIEGRMQLYLPALVNALGVDGFTITGNGTIDGNGHRFWDEFWIRRKVNPKCTNLEALRPQLVYVANSNDVTIQDVRLLNSGFWTTHLYRCNRFRMVDTYIESPTKEEGEIHAPSTDGVDLDVCDDVVIRRCYINVCDDAVCLKGGKGTYVDQDSTAGAVNRVLVEGCRFGRYSNGGITFGSEAWSCHNIVMRDCRFEGPYHMVLFKMRGDTPQVYENVLVERCTGSVRNAVELSPWTQFFSKEDRADMPRSVVRGVTVRDCELRCSNKFYDVRKSADYDLSRFSFSGIKATAKSAAMDTSFIDGCEVKDVEIEAKGGK